MKRIFFILLSLAAIHICYGGGFNLYCESAADVLGRGGAGVAGGPSATQAWYNNAATIGIKTTTMTGGLSIMRLSSSYYGKTTKDDMEDDPRYCGYFYGAHPISDEMVFTLSVNAPFGMVTSWPRDSQLSDLATYTSLRVCYISPGLAVKVHETLAVGAGFNLAIGSAQMASQIDYETPSGAVMRGINKAYLDADGYGLGYFLSLKWQPLDDWAFGAHYQSSVRMELNGDATYQKDMPNFDTGKVSTSIELPAYVVLGVENTSIKDWRFLFDAKWTQWSCYDYSNIYFKKYPGTGEPDTSHKDNDWHNVWSYHLGTEYSLTECWTLRAGCFYDLSPSNDRSRSPEMPDSDKIGGAIGVGYQGEHWGFDIAYSYVYFQDADLGTESAADSTADYQGNFETDCHILAAQVTYKF